MSLIMKWCCLILVFTSMGSSAEKVYVSGVVVDGEGRPLADMEVVGDYMVKSGLNGMRSIPVGPVITGRDGRFKLEDFPVGKKVGFRARNNYYSTPSYIDWEILSEGFNDLTLRAYKLGKITGRIVDADGNPLVEEMVKRMGHVTEVRLEERSYSNGQEGPKIIKGGYFTLEKCLPGKHALLLTYGDKPKQRILHYQLQEGEEHDVGTVVYDPDSAITISGRIIDKQGKPFSNMHFTAVAGEEQHPVVTDENGCFVVGDISEEKYMFIDFSLSFQPYDKARQRDVMAGTEDMTIVIDRIPLPPRPEPLSFNVIDALSGKSIPIIEYKRIRIGKNTKPEYIKTRYWDD